MQRNPYLNGYSAFKIDAKDFAKIPDAIKGQVTIVVRDDNGKIVDVTGVQLWGVLDALYPYDGQFGVTWDGSTPILSVWAPTAQSVNLNLFDSSDSSNAQKLPMQWDSKTGVWTVTGKADWKNKFYLYQVNVYVPSTGKIETNLVTDPYSFSLSTNSKRSQIVDLNDSDLKPQDWDSTQKPVLAAPADADAVLSTRLVEGKAALAAGNTERGPRRELLQASWLRLRLRTPTTVASAFRTSTGTSSPRRLP